MNVLWVTPGYPWAGDPANGVFYRSQARALARLGVSVTVICPTPFAPWPLPLVRRRSRLHATAPARQTDGGVRIIRPRYVNIPRQPAWAMTDRAMAAAAWRAREAWGRPQLIHGHYAITGLAAYRLSLRSALPLALTFHGSDMNRWPDEHPDRRPDLTAAARHARAVFAVSVPLARRALEVTGVAPEVLPLGSDHRTLASHSPSRADARAALGIPDGRVVVLFVGNLLLAKGVRELVDALAVLGPPFLGLIVGGGPEAGYGSDRLDRESIRYVGPQPHAAVPTYLAAADVLVLPSQSEGLPTVLVEAGSLGVPVVASRVGGIPELLGTDRGRLLEDVSVGSIVQALRAFQDDVEGAALAARRLREHVLESHDVDRNAQLLLDRYRSIVG